MVLSEHDQQKNNGDDQVEERIPEINYAVEPVEKGFAEGLPRLYNLKVDKHSANYTIYSEHHYR